MSALEEVFDRYYAAGQLDQEVEVIAVVPAVKRPSLQQYRGSFLTDTVNSVQQAERAKTSPRDELKAYLISPLEATDNVLHCGILTDTKLCNLLTVELFEALQLLKSAYQNGHISPSVLAAKHIDALITELDDFGYGADAEALAADD
ncbi:hypothetical protein C8R45DRAFT_1094741 [Mycena sanguinolenta]|nr:hypothetical protein C8R45DRAFT_1094741 [Mycena sanguinolenta]